jgi:hypothetical protein
LARPPLAIVALPLELPRPLPAGIPLLLNAVAAPAGPHTVVATRYLQCHLRLTLEADERRTILVTAGIRLSDGACVATLRLDGAYSCDAPPLTPAERQAAERALRMFTVNEGPGVMQSALDSVKRRASRDLERLHEYFASLDKEMAHAARRARSPEERARREQKRAALSDDLGARRAQLTRRLSPRLSAHLVGAILVQTDVRSHPVRVRRRSRDGVVHVDRRAGDGTLEGPRCTVCGRETLRFYLCDEQLHVLCHQCGQAGRLDASRCGACQKRG